MQGRENFNRRDRRNSGLQNRALVSELVQAGAGVSVVLTESAKEFIGAATFEALTGRPVPRGPVWRSRFSAGRAH